VQNLEVASKKRSIAQKGRKGRPLTESLQKKMQDGRIKSRMKKNVVVGDKWTTVYDILDITHAELEKYRQEHKVCEICKKSESIVHKPTNRVRRLAIDHDHNTKKFRGLLCTKCNMNYDWFLANSTSIQAYASK
jgi:hypothetical protein